MQQQQPHKEPGFMKKLFVLHLIVSCLLGCNELGDALYIKKLNN